MNLKPVSQIPDNSRVLLRIDADVPIENEQILDNQRLVKSVATIEALQKKKCKILVLGHRGRPEGIDKNLSLKPVYLELLTLLANPINSIFIDEVMDEKKIEAAVDTNDLVFLENLRFWSQEEANEETFKNYLARLGEAYINDAFAVAHRQHASIMLWQKMPAYYGMSFIEEAEKIGKIVDKPERPLTIILGGAKEDKLKYLNQLAEMADWVLVGGKLPKIMTNDQNQMSNEKVKIAKLRNDGLDLSDDDITHFKEIIGQAKMIVWAGAMGWYEKSDCRKGTEEIAKAMANSNAYKIIAGGDTGASVKTLGLGNKIDFVCSGGGVMLEFLVKKTLPAWGNNEQAKAVI